MALFQTSRRLAPVTLRASRSLYTSASSKADSTTNSYGLPQTRRQKQPDASPDFGIAPKQPGFDLPPMNAKKDVSEQGWQLGTVVRPSTVTTARESKGRFAAEPVKVKSVVVQKPLVPMAKIDTFKALPNDVTITFSSNSDLDKYIDLSMSEGGHSREEVLNMFEHFVYGFDGQRACLNVAAWTLNHADHTQEGLNVEMVEKTLPGGSTALSGEALVDIQVNDELCMDYRRFELPEFYLAYATEHGFKDVRTATMEAVYGGCYQAMVKRQSLSLPVYNAAFLLSGAKLPLSTGLTVGGKLRSIETQVRKYGGCYQAMMKRQSLSLPVYNAAFLLSGAKLPLSTGLTVGGKLASLSKGL